MSFPYQRGSSSNNSNNTMQRPSWNNSSSHTSPYPSNINDRANEVSTSLMELENNQRWVSRPLLLLNVFNSFSQCCLAFIRRQSWENKLACLKRYK